EPLPGLRPHQDAGPPLAGRARPRPADAQRLWHHGHRLRGHARARRPGRRGAPRGPR
ncbi:MAG: hypothetical protein AVDCRST_MAG05-1288, partial [uncultured Rubrobacteraceae bacterium]